jgi:hypothetical protein
MPKFFVFQTYSLHYKFCILSTLIFQKFTLIGWECKSNWNTSHHIQLHSKSWQWVAKYKIQMKSCAKNFLESQICTFPSTSACIFAIFARTCVINVASFIPRKLLCATFHLYMRTQLIPRNQIGCVLIRSKFPRNKGKSLILPFRPSLHPSGNQPAFTRKL